MLLCKRALPFVFIFALFSIPSQASEKLVDVYYAPEIRTPVREGGRTSMLFLRYLPIREVRVYWRARKYPSGGDRVEANGWLLLDGVEQYFPEVIDDVWRVSYWDTFSQGGTANFLEIEIEEDLDSSTELQVDIHWVEIEYMS
jgi:hypothetical protein